MATINTSNVTYQTSTTGTARWSASEAAANPLANYPYLHRGNRFPNPPVQTPALTVTSLKVTSNTVGYFNKLKKGDFLPINPYRRELEEIRNHHGYAATRSAGPLGEPFYGTGSTLHMNLLPVISASIIGGSYVDISASALLACDNECQNRTRLKVGDQKAGLAETLFTLNKTVDMFGTNAIRIVGAINSLRRGNIVGAWKALGVTARKRQGLRFSKSYATSPQKAIASMWLELQYGWKPLLSDVYGSLEVLHGRLAKRGLYERATASSKRSLESTIKPTPSLKTTIYARSNYRVRYVVYYKIIDQEMRTLQQLGLINPAQLAWDLLPMSFVVDWFLPIGTYLQALTATAGLQFVAGCKSTRYTREANRSDYGRQLVAPLSVHTYDFMASSWRKKVEFNRTVITSWPAAALPAFKNPISEAHLKNALALLITFKRK